MKMLINFLMISSLMLSCNDNRNKTNTVYSEIYQFIQASPVVRDSMIKFLDVRLPNKDPVPLMVSDSIVFIENSFMLDELLACKYGAEADNKKAEKDSLLVAEYRR